MKNQEKKYVFFQGYLNQLHCLRALKRQKEAMQVTNECLKRTTDENTIYGLLSDALDIAASLEGKKQKFLEFITSKPP